MSALNKAISGVKWTTVSSISNAGIHILQLMILARYLTPHDFGISAILIVVIGFSQTFVDFGLSKSIIYKSDVSSEQLSTLYWLNILLSLIVYVFIFFLSPIIADFYNEKSLDKLIILISISFVFQSFGQQYRTLFQKELKFDILAKIDIFSMLLAFILSVLLAINQYGIYAIVYSVILMSLMKSILLVYFGLSFHKPSLRFNLSEVKEFIVFGSYSVGSGLAGTIMAEMDTILIGKLLGTETLGLYNIIKDLILKPAQLINPIIIKTAFPTMSKYNNDINKVKTIFLKLINYVSSINFPIYIASFILAPEIITIFLGEKWLSGVTIFQILSIWALIRSRGNPTGALIMALGKPQYGMYWNIWMIFFNLLVVLISYRWGIEGIALANLIGLIILFIPGWYFLVYKLCKIPLKEYFLVSFYPLIISIITGIVVYVGLYIYSVGLIYKFVFSFIVGLPILWVLNKKYNQDFYDMLLKFIGR
jgi:O-antigen/teichoic acid export membrane protein